MPGRVPSQGFSCATKNPIGLDHLDSLRCAGYAHISLLPRTPRGKTHKNQSFLVNGLLISSCTMLAQGTAGQTGACHEPSGEYDDATFTQMAAQFLHWRFFAQQQFKRSCLPIGWSCPEAAHALGTPVEEWMRVLDLQQTGVKNFSLFEPYLPFNDARVMAGPYAHFFLYCQLCLSFSIDGIILGVGATLMGRMNPELSQPMVLSIASAEGTTGTPCCSGRLISGYPLRCLLEKNNR